MVGLNPFTSRHSSPLTGSLPPSYKENDPSPLLFSETTVTEVVTTTTHTTHFFSLPLHWKAKRTASPDNSSGMHIDVDEMAFPSSSKLKLDKDLPPTPTDDTSPNPETYAGQEPTLFLQSESSKFSFGGSPRPTSTSLLAQASLGLSLPHVLPQSSASSSSEINSISFASTPSSSEILPPRRELGHGKPRAVSTTSQSAPPVPSKRRNRGLSLGPSGFLSFGSADAKGKGKEKEKETEKGSLDSANSTPTKLSRRASFWSRRKGSNPDTLPQARRSEVNLVPLPALPPFTPLSLEMLKPPSWTDGLSQPLSSHSRGLSRSHSEKLRHSLLKPPDSASALSPLELSKPSRARRPMTADGPSRPKLSPLTSAGLSGFTSSPLASPTLEKHPESAAPQRPRAQTNPPLLHRLSMNLFYSSSSTPSPVPPMPLVTSSSPLRISTSKPTNVPKPQVDEESPEVYLDRLIVSVSKAEIGGILALSNDSFHVQALRSYIGRFDFANHPLDVALRRLLMDVGLPRETQQIDRVMEAFASRYYQLHPGLFTSEDQPYVLAFSLMMLHTDTFNKSNKRKMTKSDYVKNTRMPGVAPEVLDCFYDNIVFAPFIYVEDPVDVNGQRGFSVDGNRNLSSSSSSGNLSGSTLLKVSKVDPYYLISNDLLDPLRVDVELFVPLINPYSSEGTGGPWNEEELQRAFANPNVIEMGSLDSARIISPAPFFSTGGSAAGPFGFSGELLVPNTETWSLKATKVGLLNRKDDLLEGGKKASSRKWKSFSVVLTGSQLLFVRDPTWATTFLNQSQASPETGYLPSATVFKPDEVISVKDAVAVYDRSYLKHDNTFRLALSDGRHFLFGSESASEMNQWISRINYAGAFKSTGVRMRPVGMSGRDVQLTGVAAATSHLHDLQHHQSNPDWDSETSRDLMDMLSEPASPFKKEPQRRVTILSMASNVDNDVPVAPEVDGADQFKATFDQVKADLAAGRCASPDDDSSSEERKLSLEEPTRLPSRSRVVVSKIRDLESEISASQSQLESDMRFVRNVATLTPFQRSTRERLMSAVQSIAKRIMQVRLDLVRYTCHRDVLYNDLEAEAKDWSRAKKLALRAATETLQGHQKPPVPRMTLSFHESGSVTSPPVSIPTKTYTPSSESTAGSFQSFHSAFEFGPDWPSPDDTASTDRQGAHRFLENSSHGSSHSDLPKEGQEESVQSQKSSKSPVERVSLDATSPRASSDDIHHERFYTARESAEEQAEEWNKTRCAQRVSLVRVPSAYHLSRKFGLLNDVEAEV